jgi:hypothetical protein
MIMGRKPLNLSDDDRKERLRLQKKKYQESDKGKIACSRSAKKYQDSDEYRRIKREEYHKKKPQAMCYN